MKLSEILMITLVLSGTAVKAEASETARGIQKDYETFKSEMSVKLDAVRKQLDQLKGQAIGTGNQVEQKTTGELEKQRTDLKNQLDHAQRTSESAWKRFKNNFADSVDQLNAKLQKAARSK